MFISRIVGDLLVGFLVLYTYLTTSIINEKENNIINKNNNEPSKSISKCALILIVSIIEFASRVIYPILALYFKIFEKGEMILLPHLAVLSRIFFLIIYLKSFYINII